MKILFATAHFGFLRNFESGLRELAARGHRIHLLADRRDTLGGMRTVERLAEASPDAFTWSVVPPPKTHPWRALSTGFRLSLDYWRYLGHEYDHSPALRARAAGQLPAFAQLLAKNPLARIAAGRRVMARLVRACERAMPPSPHVDQVLDEIKPDLLIVTPLLYFGSQQVDYVRAARGRGLPTMLGVGSWDHLTTKGLIHEIPDAITVWNEAQREEAAHFHGVPPDVVRVTGSPAYDHWFAAAPTLDREAFCARVGLPADRPLLLYLCSSPFITPYEVDFVREWLAGVRSSADPALRHAAILIRPHPQNAEQWKEVDFPGDEHVAVWPRTGANPVDQEARNDYYHSMFYSTAVVGVNTSALIESGIVGRPVYSIRAAQFAATQEGTLHFQHLTGVNGGLLSVANSIGEHCQQLSSFLAQPTATPNKGRAFIEAFIRPHGLDVPAARVFADVVETVAQRRPEATRQGPTFLQAVIRPVLYPAAVVAQKAATRPQARITADGEERRARRLLFVMSSPEYLRFYDETIRELARQGAQVLLAVNQQREGKPVRVEQFAGSESRIRFAGIVPQRQDMWAPLADAVRGTMDFVRYLDPRLSDAPVLRARMKRKCLPRTLQWLDRIRSLRSGTVRWLLRVLAALERAIPVAGPVAAFVQRHEPDAVLVTPLVEAASPQVDIVRAAQANGIPVAACIASWDNLTNKGLLRVQPDLVAVWNEIQAREAEQLHGVPRERVAVTGAQPFDRWFASKPSRSREEFCAQLQLDPARPIVLFTGSSFFISGEHSELPFVRKWLQALRQSADETLRSANVLVRPHPYNADQWADANLSDLGPAAVHPRGRHNPTDAQNRHDFFDALYHCGAVVGVNTSAMIEAAIVGRPVHSVLTPDFAGTQEGTLHFRYLLPENGGFLRVGRTFEQHFGQLAASLADPAAARAETGRFVASFIRPNGIDSPCVPILAESLLTLAQRGAVTPMRAGAGGLLLRALLVLPVAATGALARATHPSTRKRYRLALHHRRKATVKWLREMRKRVSLKRARRAVRGVLTPGSGRSGGT